MTAGEYTIVHEIQELKDSEHLCLRVLNISKGDDDAHTVTHCQFKSWEDTKPPLESSYPVLKDLLETMADEIVEQYLNMMSNDTEPGRALVHC